ncbi:hypothetical protein CTI12_AA331330 [Artemisia annua]|uniref:DUF4283 domain-containing protein n=1 Tax=Artemisia annua TaxID=35608 RepID=A0A2U1MY39_ARTAN|nr:hypothetical protein CTI12_AA331330 [Artemisia annua]
MGHGKVVDVYIARKMSKVGKRFGFIRFMGVGDDVEFAKKLSLEWIDNYHLYVSVARFKRSNVNRREHPRMAKHNSTVNNHGIRSQASYANVVAVVLAKVREVETMEKLYYILECEGFTDVDIHHVGGLWVWIAFKNQSACQKFKNKVSLRPYFSVINPVMRNFVVDERMVWIEIEGLPLCAWSSEALKKIGRLWGTFMFFDDDSGENVSCGRLCIRTSHKSIISEVIKVVVAEVSYIVRVREVGVWSTDIKKQNEESDSNLSVDGSEELDMEDDLDMYVKENNQAEPQKEEASVNCKETTQDIGDCSIKDNLCDDGSQNDVRPEEENATKTSRMKLNEGDASSNC